MVHYYMAPPKTKKNNRRGMSNKNKRSKRKGMSNKNKRSKRNGMSNKNKRSKKSILNARMVSKKRYTDLLKKKTMRKKMAKKDKKELDKALFVNYCKCIKQLKYSKDYQEGAEYPICMASVYTNRSLKPPKDVAKKCKRYF